MHPLHLILADTESIPIKAIIFIIAMIFWGISALGKMAKKGAENQKRRMLEVRDSIQQAQQADQRRGGPFNSPNVDAQTIARQQALQAAMLQQTGMPMPRAPGMPASGRLQSAKEMAMRTSPRNPQRPTRVQLAQEIAMRIPPQVRPMQRRAAPRSAIPAWAGNRAATNYTPANPVRRGKKQSPFQGSTQPARPAPAPPPLPKSPGLETSEQAPTAMASTPPLSTSRRSVGIGSAVLRTWLRPATLRQQFILTEVFQPPITLRPPVE